MILLIQIEQDGLKRILIDLGRRCPRRSQKKRTSEFLRANEVKNIVSQVDYLLDIHSMQKPCVPLMMAGMLNKGIDFARDVGMQMPIISDSDIMKE